MSRAKTILKILLKIFLFILLTVITQIGGLVYLLSEIIIKKYKSYYRLKKAGLFLSIYLFFSFLVIPYLAPIFGREKIKDTSHVEAHTFFTKLCNRNYVTPTMQHALNEIGKKLTKKHSGIKLIYLDANFPFFNGFPLLPHLSHNDGKKIDISFVYTDNKAKPTNKKPSLSGYGIFAVPHRGEHDQISICKGKGYWQYDFTKYVTFGTINSRLKFSENATKDLILSMINEPKIGKIFIEPHLKNRLLLNHRKIRFHGCQAVRHDDHIHMQLK